MKLTHEIDYTARDGEHQVLEIVCDVTNCDDIYEIQNYDVYLYINGKKIADVTRLMSKAGIFDTFIDDIDWEQKFIDAQGYNKIYNDESNK